MTKQYDLWGNEIPEEPPKPPKKKYKKPASTQFVREPTDIDEWLGMNAPSSSQALKDLRQALYTQKDNGDYRVQYAGEDRFRLFGPHSKVLIVSDKARHYLLRSLCRYRQFNGL